MLCVVPTLETTRGKVSSGILLYVIILNRKITVTVTVKQKL